MKSYETPTRKCPLVFSGGAQSAHLHENRVRLDDNDDTAANQQRCLAYSISNQQCCLATCCWPS